MSAELRPLDNKLPNEGVQGVLAVPINLELLEEFKKEVLGEKSEKYTDDKILKLAKLALGFSNAFIHLYKKRKEQN